VGFFLHEEYYLIEENVILKRNDKKAGQQAGMVT
jgi:hypothetical protein